MSAFIDEAMWLLHTHGPQELRAHLEAHEASEAEASHHQKNVIVMEWKAAFAEKEALLKRMAEALSQAQEWLCVGHAKTLPVMQDIRAALDEYKESHR